MGTPKKKSESWNELRSPTIAEKIRLLNAAKEAGRELSLGALENFLEGIREIVLPLVKSLDQRIFSETELSDNCSIPKEYRNRKGVRLFENHRLMEVWLTRSGKWFLRLRDRIPGEEILQELETPQFAALLTRKADSFLWRALRDTRILDKMPFVRDIALYNAVFLQFAAQCSEVVKKLIKERERRLLIMKERLSLLEDFGQALDPLAGQERELLSMKGYSLFKRGRWRHTGDYFHQEALGPHWEEIRRLKEDREEYEELVTNLSFDALKKLLQQLEWIFEEVFVKTPRDANARTLFGHNSGRLPLTKEEMAILEALVASVKA